MLMNMFMIFDPINLKLPLNLIFSFMSMLMLIKMFWMNNMIQNLIINFNNLIIKFNIMNNKFILNLTLTLIKILLLINLLNLNPNFLSFSNNLLFTLNMTLMFWMNMIIYWLFNNNLLFMNLSPKNTPMKMMWIINLIELNSIFFQIISLSMRLMINMMMGHIIILLINNLMMIYLYMLFELMIIFIQTYIFLILNILNFNNMN